MPVTRPRSMSAGATWRNTTQSKPDARQRAASRNCRSPRKGVANCIPENSFENQAGTRAASASCFKKRASRSEAPAHVQTGSYGNVEAAPCARLAASATIANKESNAYLGKGHEVAEKVKASAAVTSDALADSALKRSEDLLREFAALDLAGDDISQLLEEQDNRVQSIEELGPEFASGRRAETVQIPVELVDMFVESWKKYRSTLGSVEDRKAQNDDSIKVRRSPSPDPGISSASTTLADTDSDAGSMTDSIASPKSFLKSPRGEFLAQCIMGDTQRPTDSPKNADVIKIPSSPVRTMRSGISTPCSEFSTPQPAQPPTKVLRVPSSSVHMPTRVFTPNTTATSKITSKVKCTTFRQTVSITKSVHIYSAC